MKLLPLLLFGFGFSQHPMLAQEKADPAAQAFEDFEKRVSDYVKVHKTAISEVHKLKPTNSPEDIRRHEHHLARRIRTARATASHGDILTPAICEELRRLVARTMKGPEAGRIRASLLRAASAGRSMPEYNYAARFSAPVVCLTTSTEQGACFTTPSETLLSRSLSSSDRSRIPTTIRSALHSFAWSMIAASGAPSSAKLSAWRPFFRSRPIAPLTTVCASSLKSSCTLATSMASGPIPTIAGCNTSATLRT